jgi:hypothetical protein
MRSIRHGSNIDEGERWVTRSLDPDQFGVLVFLKQLLHVDLDGSSESNGDTVRMRDLGKVTMRATVEIGNGNDVRARGERLQGSGHSGEARRERKSVLGILERCYGMFKIVAVGVGAASVLVRANWATEMSLGKCCGQRDLRNSVRFETH